MAEKSEIFGNIQVSGQFELTKGCEYKCDDCFERFDDLLKFQEFSRI